MIEDKLDGDNVTLPCSKKSKVSKLLEIKMKNKINTMGSSFKHTVWG